MGSIESQPIGWRELDVAVIGGGIGENNPVFEFVKS